MSPDSLIALIKDWREIARQTRAYASTLEANERHQEKLIAGAYEDCAKSLERLISPISPSGPLNKNAL